MWHFVFSRIGQFLSIMSTLNQKAQRHLSLYVSHWAAGFSVLLLAVFCAGLFASTAIAQSRCFPEADGVPYMNPDNPVWWDDDGNGTFPDYPKEDDRLDDPRWHGAFGYGHGGGTRGGSWKGSHTANQVQFRAVHTTTGGTKYLYLSWVVKAAPTLDSESDARAFVGFHQSGAGGGNDVILEFQRASSSSTTGQNELNSQDIKVLVHQPDNSQNGWSEDDWSPWVDGAKARMWAAKSNGPSPYNVNVGSRDIIQNRMWAIQVRIPLGSGGDPKATSDPKVPIDPSQPFNFWYEAWVPVQKSGGVTYAAQYPFLGNNYITKLNPGDLLSPLKYPSQNSWPRVRLANSSTSSGCTVAGVTLDWSDIGTQGQPPNEIRLGQNWGQTVTNTFFAAPTNQTPTPIGSQKLAATFRMANWGSQIGSSQSSGDLWEEIPGAVDVQNTSSIPAGSQGSITFNWDAQNCMACEFQDFYSRNQQRCSRNCSNLPSPKGTSHQCILVELENNTSSSSLEFTNQSVYRNMDFVTSNSTFERDATISVRGLGDSQPRPEGGEFRVLLFEEKQNLYLEADSLNPRELVLPPTVYGQIEGVREYATTEESPRWRSAARDTSLVDLVDRQLPTYRVYAYRETGLEIQEEDPDRRVRLLRPQTSFGYHVFHRGPLEGWRTRLSGGGVEGLAPRVHQVSVPMNGRVMIQNAIQAVEPGEEPINDGDEIDKRLMEARRDGSGTGCSFLRGGGNSKGASLPVFFFILLLGVTGRVAYRSLYPW